MPYTDFEMAADLAEGQSLHAKVPKPHKDYSTQNAWEEALVGERTCEMEGVPEAGHSYRCWASCSYFGADLDLLDEN